MKLKKLKIIFGLVALAIGLVACQKEVDFQDLNGPGPGGGGGATIDLLGNWNFVGLSAKLKATITASQAGQELKEIVLNEYATDPPTATGTLSVTTDQFKFFQIGHTVIGTLTAQTFLNGLLIDNQAEPINEVTDPADEIFDYVRNSNDSVTFTNGFTSLPDPSGTPPPAGPIGAKLSMSSDTLSVKIKTNLSQNGSQGGIPVQVAFDIESTMRFKRQ
jgi:hypothetical protein